MTRYRFAILLFFIFSPCLLSTVYYLPDSGHIAMHYSLVSNAFAQQVPAGQALLEEGVKLFKAEKFNEAIKILKEFSQLSPDNHLSYYYIGFSHFRLGDKIAAKEALGKAVELKPDFVPAHMGLAVIYEGEGRLDLAKKEYETVIATAKEEGEVKIAKERLKRADTILSAKHAQEAKRLVDEGKIEEAIAELSIATELTPENIAIQMSLGSLYIHQRKPKEAIETYERAKELAPASPEIYMRLAELYQSISAFKEAIDAFREVIKLAPETEMSLEASKKINEAEDRLKTRGYFEEAAQAIREERLDDALAATQKVLEIEPRNSFVYFNLGVIYTKKKMYADAIGALNRAIAIYPKYVEAYYQLGVVYDDQSKFDEAIAEYEAAVAIGREDVEETKKARERLKLLKEVVMTKEVGEKVRVLMEGGDLEGALREAEKIVAVTKNENDLLIYGQLYLSRKEFDKAIEAFDHVIKINPKNWEAYLLIAQSYEGKKNYREAKAYYSKVVSAGPDTEVGKKAKSLLNQIEIKTHFENASDYRKKGDIEGALHEIRSILELAPDDPVALYNAGVLYYMLEMPDKAVPPLTKAIEKVPDYVQAHLQLALIYEYLRRYAEAEAEFNAVLSLTKEGKEADIAKSRLGLLRKEEAFSSHMKAAMELIQKGKYEEALEEVQAIIIIAPENYIAHYTAGFIYERLDKLEEAKAAFQKAIEVNPEYARSHFGLARVYEREGFYEDARETYKKTISVGEGTREAEMAAISLQRLKKWRIQASMNNNVNNVVSTDGKKNTGTATNYGVSLSYDIHKTRQEGLNLSSVINRNIYYEYQMTAMGYGADIAWSDVFSKDHSYGVSAGYTNYTFDNKPDYKNYRYSVNTDLRPGVIPTSISLRFDYSDNSSFVSKLRDTVQHALSLSVTQNTSEWDSVTGSYSFISYQNKDPVGSNFAYRSNNISLEYTRRLWPAFSAGGGYNLKLINYANPDSTTFFTKFRRNVFHGASLNMSYRMADKARFSLRGDISQETTNIPTLKEEELAELGERLVNPIPRFGGWDKSRAVGMSGYMDYRLSEKVNLSVNAGNTWVTTEPEAAGSYRKLNLSLTLSTLF